jgi:PleD family two-component response regulator
VPRYRSLIGRASSCPIQERGVAKGGTLCRELTTAETISTVIVIDDNQAIREAIGSLLRSVGLQAKLLASADEFLKTGRQAGPAFLVLDVRLPGRSGLGRLGSDWHNQTGSASAATARRRGSKSLQHSLE